MMMKSSLRSLALLFLLHSTAQAQTPSFTWATRWGATGQDDANSIATDAAGNTVVLGLFEGTIDGDPGMGTHELVAAQAGTKDLFVVKLDPQGQHLWSFSLGIPENNYDATLAVDPGGNIVITGVFAGATDLDPGPGSYTLTTDGTKDVFILKLAPDGGFLWARSVGSTYNDQVYSLATDMEGNVLIAGSTFAGSDLDPGAGTYTVSTNIFLLKMDANGDFVWAVPVGPGVVFAQAMCTDAAGSVYLAGNFNGAADMDPGPDTYELTSAGLYDIFVLKLQADGSFVRARRMGGPADDRATAIAVDGAGNAFVTGLFSNGCNFDPGVTDLTFTTVNGGDAFTLRLDPQGSLVWAFQIGGSTFTSDVGNGIAVDGQGRVYITGELLGTSDMDPGAGTFTLSTGGTTAVYVQCVQDDGTFRWAFKIGAPGFNYDSGRGIAVDEAGHVHVVGTFEALNVDFDPGTTTFNMSSAGIGDGFVLDIDPDLSTALDDIERTTATVAVFPNPARSLLFVRSPNAGNMRFRLMDVTGGELVSTVLRSDMNMIDLPEHSGGTYLYVIQCGGGMPACGRVVLD